MAKEHPILDVRSPAEYSHAHIPGAHSLPLFSDEERKIVGTTYKQESREKAIKVGLDYFGVKMRRMVEETETLVAKLARTHAQPNKTVLVHCWRGGMRSAGVAWLLDLYGFKVYTLTGGYKKFRHYVLETFTLPLNLKLIGGYTGSGKTQVLAELKKRNEPVICLESIASHKGSAFGNIERRAQPGQEMFENLLAMEIRVAGDSLPKNSLNQKSHDPPAEDSPEENSPGKTIWLEDESQRIGLVNIPHPLWKRMRNSGLFFLDIPFEARLEHIVSEYGHLDREKLVEAIGRISQKLGHLNAKTAILLLNEGKIAESFAILLKYYDKHYLKSLHNRESVNALLHKIISPSVTPENASLVANQNNISRHSFSEGG